MYYEETDLCARVKKAGWKIFSVPEAKIIHLEGQSFGTKKTTYPSNVKINYLEKGRQIFYDKNTDKTTRWLANSLYFLFLKSRILLIKDRQKKDYYKLRLQAFSVNKH